MIKQVASLTLALSFCSHTTGTDARLTTQGESADQDQVVQLKTELVQVRAVVTDRQGKIIEGLKKEDFEVVERGRPQEIGFFSQERINFHTKEGGPLIRGRQGESPETQPARTGPIRSVILFVDTLHLAAPNLLRVKQALNRFVDEQVTDQDLVLVTTSTGLTSGFDVVTADRRSLHHVVDRITPWRASRESRFTPYLAAQVKGGATEALDVALEVMQAEDGLFVKGLPQNVIRQMLQAKAAEVLADADYRRAASLSALKAVAERAADLPGQRLLILVSDGFTLMSTNGGAAAGVLQPAISKAVRSGVIIYSLDAKGLRPPFETDASLRGVGGDAVTMGRFASFLSASEREQQEGINALAADTGGRSFFNTNDLIAALKSALDDNQSYYVLAYYPSDLPDSNEFRQIQVRVKGHPEYSVRTQRGYLASDFKPGVAAQRASSPQQRLLQALASPLPLTAIGVGALADYVESDADSSQVSLEAWIDGKNLSYREQNGRFRLELDVAAVVYDRAGQPVSTHIETIRGDLSSHESETAKRAGFRYGRRLKLKPGYYQVRVGARDSGSDHIGTAISWVEVPALSKGKLALSSILLSEAVPDARKPAAVGAGFNPRLGVKNYSPRALLVYYVMIYNATSRSVETDLMTQFEILRRGEPIHVSDWTPIGSRLVGKSKKGIPIGGQIDLDIEQGVYQLRISVKDIKSKQVLQQTTAFGVGS